jgi:hypothetical protein
MTGLEVLLAVVGGAVTMLVIAAMILITPRGQLPVHDEGSASEASNLSPARAPGQTPTVSANTLTSAQ